MHCKAICHCASIIEYTDLGSIAYYTPWLLIIPLLYIWFITHQTIIIQHMTISQAPSEEGQGLGVLLTKNLGLNDHNKVWF